MKIIKKISAVLCSLALLSVTGCDDEPVVKQQTSDVEITFSWWGNDARNQYTIEAIEKFQEVYPYIKVKCSYSEWSGFEARNRVQMISDTEADVMQINFGWLSQYSEDGTGYYDLFKLGSKIDFDENFAPEMLSYGIIGDKLNAIPIAMNAETVYINKTIYDSYGLDVPKTWSDLFDAAKVMKKDGVYPISGPAKSVWLYLIAYTEQTVGHSFLNENGDLNFTKSDFKVMEEFYQKLVEEKVLPQPEHYERINLDDEKYAGAVAWISDAVNYFGKAVENGREIVIADYTTIDGNDVGEGWYAKPATMYAISNSTAHPEEAALLLDYLLNSSQMARLQGVEKGIPLSKKAQETIEKDGMLDGIQYEASQKMESVPLSQLNPVLENADLIDSFFAMCNDIIYEVTEESEAIDTFYETAKDFCS